MTESDIPYGRQSIDESDIAAVASVLRSNWLTTGPAVPSFERALADIAGSPVAVVSSGTAALHLAYAAAGVGPGDEVITTPLTFAATAAAALHLGAVVKLADIDPHTLNIDPDRVSQLATERTKVITAVDFAGLPADLDSLRSIAHRVGALLVEDAAHSLGATYRGSPVGSIADMTTFSFHPVKLVTTGEGGAVAATDPILVERVRLLRNHGLVNPGEHDAFGNRPWHRVVHTLGYNYRLADILAALGESQLSRIEVFLARRRELAQRYLASLAGVQGIRLPAVREDIEHAWHLFVIRVPAESRPALHDHLRAHGIGSQVHYIPLHQHPAIAERIHDPVVPVTDMVSDELLTIPLFPAMSNADQDQVVDALRAFFK